MRLLLQPLQQFPSSYRQSHPKKTELWDFTLCTQLRVLPAGPTVHISA